MLSPHDELLDIATHDGLLARRASLSQMACHGHHLLMFNLRLRNFEIAKSYPYQERVFPSPDSA